MINTAITKDSLKASIEEFFNGFFDVIEFYILPRGIGFTGRRLNAEHTAYIEIKQELTDEQHLNDVLENFKTRFIKHQFTTVVI